MDAETLARLIDEELLAVAKHNKPSPTIDAFFIGFLIGIIIYGLAAIALALLPSYHFFSSS